MLLRPLDQQFQGQIFAERVFTFLMKTKELYLGNSLLARGTEYIDGTKE